MTERKLMTGETVKSCKRPKVRLAQDLYSLRGNRGRQGMGAQATTIVSTQNNAVLLATQL